MTAAIIKFTGAFFRNNFALLFSLAGHALVIWAALLAWRAWQSHFSLSGDTSAERVFEIEIVSPETLRRMEEERKAQP